MYGRKDGGVTESVSDRATQTRVLILGPELWQGLQFFIRNACCAKEEILD